jgi:hypothetical protein
MNESDRKESDGKVAKSGNGMKVPFLLKAVLWDKPMLMLSFSIRGLGKLDLRYSWELLVLCLLLPAFFGVILAVSSYVLLQRKGETGQFLLSTAELNEKVARDLQPNPKWKRILSSAFYFLFAGDLTFDAMSSQYHRGLHWGLAVLLLLCAILIVASEFVLSRRKQSASAHPQ